MGELEETKGLALIPKELEGLADPMRKNVTSVRKRIDHVNKGLKFWESLVSRRRRNTKKLSALSKKEKIATTRATWKVTKAKHADACHQIRSKSHTSTSTKLI